MSVRPERANRYYSRADVAPITAAYSDCEPSLAGQPRTTLFLQFAETFANLSDVAALGQYFSGRIEEPIGWHARYSCGGVRCEPALRPGHIMLLERAMPHCGIVIK